jgi:quercetin dioxygenase-like cupin family protein
MSFDTEPYLLNAGEGTALWFLGTLQTYKAVGSQTNHAFTLVECLLPPGFGPPPHIHQQEEEAFYLLEGELTVFCGERTWQVTPGSFVFLPRGIVHGFKVEGSVPAKMLQITSPAGFEHFATEVGEPAREAVLPPPGPPDVEKLLAVAAKYHLEIQIPPPGQESKSG